ncbi:hypothetical protein IWQ61_004592 [Dispira simplex]|nr:hypothetical protein IWQ61_004592 [Dispira simplex]
MRQLSLLSSQPIQGPLQRFIRPFPVPSTRIGAGWRTIADKTILYRVLQTCTTYSELATAVEHQRQSPKGYTQSAVVMVLRACARVARHSRNQPLLFNRTDGRVFPSQPLANGQTDDLDAIVRLAEDTFVQYQGGNQTPPLELWRALLNVYTSAGRFDTSLHILDSIRQEHHQLDISTALDLVKSACRGDRYDIVPGVIHTVQQVLEDQYRWNYRAKWGVTLLGLYLLKKWATLGLKIYGPAALDPTLAAFVIIYLTFFRVTGYILYQEQDSNGASAGQPLSLLGKKPWIFHLVGWLNPPQRDHNIVKLFYRESLRQLVQHNLFERIPCALDDLTSLMIPLGRTDLEFVLTRTAARSSFEQFRTIWDKIKDTPLDEEHDPTVWNNVYQTMAQRPFKTRLFELDQWLRDCGVERTASQLISLLKVCGELDWVDRATALWEEGKNQPHLVTCHTLLCYLELLIRADNYAGARDVLQESLASWVTPEEQQWLLPLVLHLHWQRVTKIRPTDILSDELRYANTQSSGGGKSPPRTTQRYLAAYEAGRYWYQRALQSTGVGLGVQISLGVRMMDMANAVGQYRITLDIFRSLRGRDLETAPVITFPYTVRTALRHTTKEQLLYEQPITAMFWAALAALFHTSSKLEPILAVVESLSTFITTTPPTHGGTTSPLSTPSSAATMTIQDDIVMGQTVHLSNFTLSSDPIPSLVPSALTNKVTTATIHLVDTKAKLCGVNVNKRTLAWSRAMAKSRELQRNRELVRALWSNPRPFT